MFKLNNIEMCQSNTHLWVIVAKHEERKKYLNLLKPNGRYMYQLL
jgi:hypothetical protein